TRFQHCVRPGRVFGRVAPRRRRAWRGPAPADDGALARSVQNTTIYSKDDRYRGLKGLRTVVLMNDNDMKDRGLASSISSTSPATQEIAQPGPSRLSRRANSPVTKHLVE